jgi:hypothetical protein
MAQKKMTDLYALCTELEKAVTRTAFAVNNETA